MEQPAAVNQGWRTSSYSNNGGATCVEVGAVITGVLVRDTTDRTGATLAVPAASWRTLLAQLRA